MLSTLKKAVAGTPEAGGVVAELEGAWANWVGPQPRWRGIRRNDDSGRPLDPVEAAGHCWTDEVEGCSLIAAGALHWLAAVDGDDFCSRRNGADAETVCYCWPAVGLNVNHLCCNTIPPG